LDDGLAGKPRTHRLAANAPKTFYRLCPAHFAPLTLNWRHNFAAEPAGQACPDIATIRKKLDPGKELLIALS